MQDNQNYKVVLLGDQFVGKRSLLNKAFNVPKRLSSLYVPIEYIQIDGLNKEGPFKVQFYDSLFRNSMFATSGNSLGDSFCAEVLPNAHAILLCYACDDLVSLKNLHEWCNIVKKFRTANTKIYLVGTKCDSRSRCDEKMYDSVRASLGSIHGGFKTSSVTGTNIESLFAHVLNSFNRLPAQMNQINFTPNMLPSQKVDTSVRRESLNISITTPKGTKNSYDKVPSHNEMTSLLEIVTPSREIPRKSIRLEVPQRETVVYSCRTDVYNQPEMSFTEGRGMLKSGARQEVQEVRGARLDTCETSFSYYDGNNQSQSQYKPSVSAIMGINYKKPEAKHLPMDFTVLEYCEDEPTTMKSNCKYILEDDSVILDVNQSKHEEEKKPAKLINEKDSQSKKGKLIEKRSIYDQKYVLNIWF